MFQMPVLADFMLFALSAGLWTFFYRRQRSLLPGKFRLAAVLFMLALLSLSFSAVDGASEVAGLLPFFTSFFVSSLVCSGFRPRMVILFLVSVVGGTRKFTAAEKYLIKKTWPQALATALIFGVLQLVFGS